jgi:starch synthase (maltosyl-transferring)
VQPETRHIMLPPHPPAQQIDEGRARVLVLGLRPEIELGQYAAKTIVGDRFTVEADLVADGHDQLAGCLRYRHESDDTWQETPLAPVLPGAGNDRWRGAFVTDRLGRWHYGVHAWVDAFATWRHGLERKAEAGVDVAVELLIGAELAAAAASRATGDDAAALARSAARLRDASLSMPERIAAALAPELAGRMARYPDRSLAAASPVRTAVADRPRARFSAWYELFPRSFGPPGRHGTLRDAEKLLPYIAELGFDVVYLPPIHPIGRTHRKGPNNSLQAGPDDPGSPWAVGGAEGGHTSIHPALGTLEDFEHFRRAAESHGLELALDIAFQASPDHPWVKEHPSWFRRRPDGTIQYAENPPKKYQDIYPFDFETEDWRALWEALAGVFFFWVERGVRIFRVDNPHTKPLRFWAWCIDRVKTRHPDVIFLAEAFTRPKLMYALAKCGFTQSYTYFTWRNTRHELETYLRELACTEVADFFRPSFWPNTPDILPETLQYGGRAAFVTRLILAATLSSNYGIYGPAFELMEQVARPGSGEYLDNEKYQLRIWDLDRADSLRHVIARVNRIRRSHPALQRTTGVEFHRCDNEHLICYSKRDESGRDLVLVVCNLDPHHRHAGWIELDLAALGVAPGTTFQVHDLLTDDRFLWTGPRNYVALAPTMPAHVFRVLRRVRSEHDFEYYL